MKSKKLSIVQSYLWIFIGIFISSSIFITSLYIITHNRIIILWGIIFILCIYIWVVIFMFLIRKKLLLFISNISYSLDNMMNGNSNIYVNLEEETLLSKVNYRIKRLSEIMKENNSRVSQEKADLEKLVSDISHQVKTPIANLKMINATLLQGNVSKKEQIDFLKSMDGQLDKLDFLMQSMIKTSRLETGIITLEKKNYSIYETVAAVMGSILFKAEKKKIQITVNCDANLFALHDRKWTTEALFNIVDNAVKYTPVGGEIHINCSKLEMYTRIDIIDNGRGIKESHQAEIFKRFYREKDVHDLPGIGIGLYLAREIITMEGGYIKVISKEGEGSTFSVFLLNS
ncbi:HAMP domain-containing histidine kinase [Clostridium sporogenes]|uniref:histidine kinase n=1 Tax=Clostridium botulinum TaxID=1491 RepID=A0A6M0T5N5_CLOBO|nr:HAMP domain-containing sensor histidine kinase [Clostridium sporogenes]NFA61431.1 HAMP domain-containing histidine kinase [Clostridium botulinum]NFI73318.1 HAMP domain-containing histidine kinase [Clostridium sporogenes]NFL72808.1 HAMP domain-containing histidine kinase [Clostridium sporogenes]NFM23177.1 HAMP domain-containing histidine kinase [Clostridium sporogenes]NFP61434.1 HAMP domain-containing histidine kinase [Clostridium sporogenes]